MSKEELAANAIARYVDLLRIQAAPDKDVELNNQLSATRALLQTLGIMVDDIVIKS